MKLAVRYHLNPKTVQKWRKRAYMRMTHQWVQKIHIPRFSVLKRKASLLLLENIHIYHWIIVSFLYRKACPSGAHVHLDYRCLKRHGVSRLPDPEGYKKPEKKIF